LEYKKLASTDLMVSRIGFGCWAIGGHGYGNVDDGKSVRAIRKALDCGVNFFDTADVYGFGRSEEVLSKALGSQINKVIIATKFGVAWDKNGNTYKDCTAKQLVSALEGSLRRLKTDCIHLYQIHWHDGKTPINDIMEALLRCRDSGKLLHIGCCNFSKELLSNACSNHEIVSFQCLYNLVKRRHEDIIKYSSKDLGISVLAYGVIGRGVFSAKYDENTQFRRNDTRAKDHDFLGERYAENISAANRLREIGEKYGKTPAQVAIKWVLENPFITCAITGIKNERQAYENACSVGWYLKQDDMEMIDSLIQKADS